MEPHDLGAVSYTHLDVYKRQEEKQPEEPTQTESEKTQEMIKCMMELMQELKKGNKQSMDCLLYTSRCV